MKNAAKILVGLILGAIVGLLVGVLIVLLIGLIFSLFLSPRAMQVWGMVLPTTIPFLTLIVGAVVGSIFVVRRFP